VDKEALPDWLGGESKGTLIDDVGPWSDPKLVASLGLDLEELKRGRGTPKDARGRDIVAGKAGAGGAAPKVRVWGGGVLFACTCE